MSVKKTIIFNSFSNFIARFSINIISFFTLPIFINYFGEGKYAIFILINSFIESLVFFDFGVGTTLGKKTAEYTINRDIEKFTIYFNWTFWLTLILSAFFGIVVFFAAPLLVQVFKIDPTFFEIGIIGFRIGSFYLLLFAVLRIYQTILEGFEKFIFVNGFKFFQIVSLLVCVFFIFWWELNFYSYLIILMIGNLFPFVIYAIYFHSKNSVRVKIGKPFFNLFQNDFWQMSRNFFAIQVTSFLFSLADKFIISIIIGASSLVYYTVVTKISYIVRMVNNQTLLVISPLISKARENNDQILISKIIKDGSMFQLLLMLPIITTSGLFLKPFIRLWIGGDFVNFAYWGVISLLIYVLGPFSGMVQRVLIYGGFEFVVKRINYVLILINLLSSIILTYFIGIGGVIIGSIIQTIIAIPIFKQKAKELLGIDYEMINKYSLIGFTISFCAILVFFIFKVEENINSWPTLIVFGTLFFIVQIVFPVWHLFIRNRKFTI